MAALRYLVVVPTYNEAENAPIITERLKALDPVPDIVFIDDESPDGTGVICEELGECNEGVFVVHRKGPRGFAPAQLAGLKWGLEKGYDYVCSMDADLSQDPDALPLLLREVAEGRADIAIGSRYVPGGALQVDWGPIRTRTSTMGNAYIRFMLGTRVRDNTTSFRCYRRDVLAEAPLDKVKSQGYSFLPELLFYLERAGARVSEIPTVYVNRRLGSSKISSKIVLEALGRVTALGLSRPFHPRRRRP